MVILDFFSSMDYAVMAMQSENNIKREHLRTFVGISQTIE